MRSVLRIVAPSLLALFALLAPRMAHGLVRAQSDYPYEQVWNAALRLVRVDLGFEVMERDQEGGFVLFKYRGDSGTFNASLEIVRAARDGKVGLVIQIPEMPRYTELWLLDRLNRKLRDEFGAAPRRPTKRPGARRDAEHGDTERGGSSRDRDNRSGRNDNGRSGSSRDGGRDGSRGRGSSGSSGSGDRRSSRSR